MDLGKLAGKLIGNKLDIPDEIGYDMLVERIVKYWKQNGKAGKGLSDGRLKLLAREALDAMGLDRLKEEDEN